MKNKQKLTPKYWIGHDPKTEDVYIDTAAKDYRSCEDKFKDIWAGDEDGFYLALTEGNIAIKLFKIDFSNDGVGDEQDMLLENRPRPWVRLECTKDFLMEDGEIAFSEGKQYMFAYSHKDGVYVTVSNEGKWKHQMSVNQLRAFFKGV